MAREDLFTVVFDQVMTDTAVFADVILPATTFLEAYDFARGYGPLSLQLVRPVIDAVGESRSNPEVFGELARRLELLQGGEPDNELEMLLQIFKTLPGTVGAQMEDDRPRDAAVRRAPDSVRRRAPQNVRSEGRSVSGSARRRSAAGSVYLSARSRDRSLSAGADFAVQRQNDQLDVGRAAAAGRQIAHAPGRPDVSVWQPDRLSILVAVVAIFFAGMGAAALVRPAIVWRAVRCRTHHARVTQRGPSRVRRVFGIALAILLVVADNASAGYRDGVLVYAVGQPDLAALAGAVSSRYPKMSGVST